MPSNDDAVESQDAETGTQAVELEFTFGPFRFVPTRRLLTREDQALKLGGRAMDLLHLLVMRAGEELSKETLIDFVWPNVIVEERNLKVHICNLRQVLQDTQPQATYIATIVGRGYQFVARVRSERTGGSEAPRTTSTSVVRLPAPSTLIGRAGDVEGTSRALGPAQLVTLVGAGGVGKSSLAIAIANAKRDDFPDGAYFVDLSTISEPGLVAHLVASALGVRGDQRDPTLAVVEQLGRMRSLVVLDNCEHLLPAVATIAERIVNAKTSSCLLATSREPLGIGRETMLRVDPLACPRHDQVRSASEAMSYPAVELFVQRARETGRDGLVDADLFVIASLCEALDGLPLAIEIAAAKLAELSPLELLDSLKPRLAGLRNDDESAHARHQTLWALLDWSYRLLSAQEASVFRSLAVFAGSFEWVQAVAMARVGGFDPHTITMTLGRLVAKSLLSVEGDGDQIRYRLLESAKAYAAEVLGHDDLAQVAHRHHARLALGTFERSEAEWGTAENRVWRDKYQRHVGDLRKALDWCFGAGGDPVLGVELATSAVRFWNEHSFMEEQRFQVDRALRHCDAIGNAPRRKAVLATSRAWSMIFARRPQSETDDAWRSAIESSESGGDLGQRLSAMSGWAHFLIYTGRNDSAVRQLREFVQASAQAGDHASVFDGERLSVLPELHLGELTTVSAKLERLAHSLALGVPPSRITRYQEQREVSINGNLAFSRWLEGRYGEALALAERVVQQTGRVGLLMGQSHTLALVAMPLALWSGRVDDLDRYATILEGNLRRENIAMYEPVQRFYAHAVRQSRGRSDALTGMRSAIDDLVRDRFLIRVPMYLGVLAEALLDAGRAADAEEAVTTALALQSRSGEVWCLPELLRIEARVLLATRRGRDARKSLTEAHRTAAAMRACFFRSRIARDSAGVAKCATDASGPGDFASPTASATPDAVAGPLMTVARMRLDPGNEARNQLT
jgi:predicted ATPase/DNA-binding winged helix-turn-helix (wHTH) protein